LLTSKIHGNFTYINKTEMYVNFNSSWRKFILYMY
jgi:hypothetical protein